jgi:hypothetical protein
MHTPFQSLLAVSTEESSSTVHTVSERQQGRKEGWDEGWEAGWRAGWQGGWQSAKVAHPQHQTNKDTTISPQPEDRKLSDTTELENETQRPTSAQQQELRTFAAIHFPYRTSVFLDVDQAAFLRECHEIYRGKRQTPNGRFARFAKSKRPTAVDGPPLQPDQEVERTFLREIAEKAMKRYNFRSVKHDKDVRMLLRAYELYLFALHIKGTERSSLLRWVYRYLGRTLFVVVDICVKRRILRDQARWQLEDEKGRQNCDQKEGERRLEAVMERRKEWQLEFSIRRV